ncbi:MAG: hypothetical protein QM813_23935 [Verrucomicrobiota bacterium]
MDALPVVSAAVLQEITKLEADILTRLNEPSATAPKFPADLAERRLQLLAAHLGYQPQTPVPVLHVLGDSHTAFFSGVEGLKFYSGRGIFTGFFRRRFISAYTELLPVFRVFHTGASTAWSADVYGFASRTREKIEALLRKDIPVRGSVLLVYGEIDCRWHIPRSVLAGKTIAAAVGETVTRFLPLPVRLARAGYDVTVWQPPGVTVAEPTPPEANHPLPTSGPQQLRLDITRAYCEQLAAACARENIRCTGIVGKYHGWNETAPLDCFLDQCHLSQRMMPLTLRTLVEAGALPLKPPTGASSPLAG